MMNNCSESEMGRGLAVAIAILTLRAHALAGDCEPQWLPSEGMPGTNADVIATVAWDPDGPGLQPEVLVAGGTFTIAGNVTVTRIASWNGSSWQPLGDDIDGGVSALTVHDGELFAGGWFGPLGTPRVARWDGLEWQPLGDALTGRIYALATFNSELIAAGEFTSPDHQVLRWTGSGETDGTTVARATVPARSTCSP